MKRLIYIGACVFAALAFVFVLAHTGPAVAAAPIFAHLHGSLGAASLAGLLIGMTTSAANTPRTFELGDYGHLPVADNVKIYEGSAIGDNGSGYARALTAADPFRGFCVEFADNTITGHTAGGIYVQYKVRGLIQLAITAAAVGDVGKAVYASDDMTFTYTATSNSYIGRVARWISTGNVVVAFDATRGGFSKETSLTDSSAGTSNVATGISANAQKETVLVPLGSLALLVNSQVFKMALPYAFQVTSALVRFDVAVTTGAKAATLTTQINGTPTTGGVISAAGAAATGTTTAATAITALNTGTAGQTIEVAVSGVTTYIEGTAHIEFTVINLDKANQAATLAAAINAFNVEV